MRRGAAAAGIAGAVLAQLDELEGARAGDRLHVAAEVDHRALAGEDAARGRRRDDGAGHAGGAADRDRRWPAG